MSWGAQLTETSGLDRLRGGVKREVDPGDPGASGGEPKPSLESASCIASEPAPGAAAGRARCARYEPAPCASLRLSRSPQPSRCVRAAPCAARCPTPHAAPEPVPRPVPECEPCVAPEAAPQAVAGPVSRPVPEPVAYSVAGSGLCALPWLSLRRVPWLSPSPARHLALLPAPQSGLCLHATPCAPRHPAARATPHLLPGAMPRLFPCPPVGV
jgi:hypothetical protein